MRDTIDIGPLSIVRWRRDQALARVTQALDAGAPLAVAFCNAHTATLALRDPAYARILSRMLLFNDGVGLDLGARLLGEGAFPDNLNGTDFTPFFLGATSRPLRIFLLGARPAVVAKASAVVMARFPQHTVVGARDGYFPEIAWPAIVEEVRASRPDVILCAMGNPRQEEIIARLAPQIGRGVYFGVGALFDFLAEAAPRAPLTLRRLRIEFLWRLAHEPRRLLRRYTLEAGEFFIAIARLRLARATTPPPRGAPRA